MKFTRDNKDCNMQYNYDQLIVIPKKGTYHDIKAKNYTNYNLLFD